MSYYFKKGSESKYMRFGFIGPGARAKVRQIFSAHGFRRKEGPGFLAGETSPKRPGEARRLFWSGEGWERQIQVTKPGFSSWITRSIELMLEPRNEHYLEMGGRVRGKNNSFGW